MNEGQELVGFDKFKAELAAFKAADAELVFNVTTPEGYADCRAYHAKLRKVYNGVNNLRLDTTKSLRSKVTDINTDGNAILAEIDAIANPRKAQFEAEDAKEAKIIADLAEKNRLAAELEVDERLAYLEYGERKLKEAEDKLKAAEDAVKAKEEAAKIEADKVLAAEVAVEKAQKKAEINAINAKTLADKAVIVAAANAKQEAKEEAAAKELEAKTKKDEDDEKERLRVADVEHCGKIEYEIGSELFRLVPDISVCTEIIEAMKSGVIPHIEIKY